MITIPIFLLTNTLFFLILMHYMDCFSDNCRFSIIVRTIYVIIASIILAFFEYFASTVLICLAGILLVFLFSLGYSGRFLTHFILPISFLVFLKALFFMENLYISVFEDLFPVFKDSVVKVVAAFICTILFILLIQTVCILQESRKAILPASLQLLLSALPVISIIIYIIITFFSLRKSDLLTCLVSLLIISLVIVSNILYFIVIKKFKNLLVAEHQNELIVQEAQLKEGYYREVEQSNQEIRRIRHDLINRLSGLYDSLNSGDTAFKQALEELMGELQDSTAKIYTSNEILNSILKLKFVQAEKLHIRVENDIMVPKYLKMEYGDMGILFGNLLDNAIEACSRLPQEHRWLRLTVNYFRGGLVLIVENSKDAEEDIDFFTHKIYPKNHGIGIKSVKRVVAKYNGIIEFKDEAMYFEASAIIYGMITSEGN